MEIKNYKETNKFILRKAKLVCGVLFVALMLILTGCADSAEDIAEQTGAITADKILENPSAYVGKTVTVTGSIDDIYGPRAFNMDPGIGSGELLVLGRDPFPQVTDAANRAYLVNDVATVTGVVRLLVTADIEREIGWDLDAQIEAEFNSKPVLIAQQVAFRPGTGAGNANATAMNAGQSNSSADQGNMNGMNANATNADRTNADGATALITDIDTYTGAQDKSRLVNRQARFNSVKVQRVVGPNTFTIGSGEEELYVMLDAAAARAVGTQGKIDDTDVVNVSGEFMKLEKEQIQNTANDRYRHLTQQERQFMMNKSVYLHATDVSGFKN